MLRINRVSKTFKDRMSGAKLVALNQVTLDIQSGEILALVGESGSGKSTLAQIIAGLQTADSGEISLNDLQMHDIKKASQWQAYRRQVQMVFQDPFSALNPVYRIGSILERPFKIHFSLSASQRRQAVLDILNKVGLSPAESYLEKFPHQISGGQRQRVGIAKALAVNPSVILADEPTSMLDVSVRMHILNLLKRIRDEAGTSILFITHDLASARYLSDRVAVLYQGELVEVGKAEAVINQPAHPYTQLLRSAAPQPERQFQAENLPMRSIYDESVQQGCAFAPRCPHVQTECLHTKPEIKLTDNAHQVRCHFAGEV